MRTTNPRELLELHFPNTLVQRIILKQEFKSASHLERHEMSYVSFRLAGLQGGTDMCQGVRGLADIKTS